MFVLSFIVTMSTGMKAQLAFCIVASYLLLKTAKFACNTATTKKEIKITHYNLQVAKLSCVLFPAIPILIHLLAIVAFSN